MSLADATASSTDVVPHDRQRRPELLFVDEPDAAFGAGEDRRAEPEAGPVGRAAAGGRGEALVDGVGDELADPAELRLGRQRPHRERSARRPELVALGGGGERVDHLVVDPSGSEDPLGEGAGLARVEPGTGQHGVDRRDDVDVVEQDGGVVAAELERHPLEVAARRHRHALPAGDRTGEADLARRRVRRHLCAELVAAADHVDDAGGQHLVQDLAEAERGERRERRRLHHHRVADAQRGGELGDRHHHREVPRQDRGDGAERTVAHLDVGLGVVGEERARHVDRGGVLQPQLWRR